MHNQPILFTDINSLTLFPLSFELIDDVAALIKQPHNQEHLQQYPGKLVQKCLNLSEQEKIHKSDLQGKKRYCINFYTKLIGAVSISTISSKVGKIEIWIDKNHCHQGFAEAVLKKLIDYETNRPITDAPDRKRYVALIASIRPDDIAGKKLFTKIGMKMRDETNQSPNDNLQFVLDLSTKLQAVV